MSFLDFLLDSDPSGDWTALYAAEQADADSGITWGIFHRGALIDTAVTSSLAECVAADEADASNLPRSAFTVEALNTKRVAA